jgi:sterol desaturase/sphingolipid hydroxylase (fatty acid hydroxylase superfamily)
MFVPLERAWAARKQRVLRRELALDLLFFFGQYVVWNAVSLYVLGRVHGAWMSVSPWGPSQLPIGVQIVLALVLGELATYWLHRAFHAAPWLWKIHAVHHSSTTLDWLAAHREHPLDGILIQLSMNLPSIVLGLSFAAFAPIVLFRGLWAIVVHSNTKLPLGPLRWVLGDPRLHRYHHAAIASDGTTSNFANLSPWLDAVFGTHHVPSDETYPLGIASSEPARRAGPVGAYLRHLLLSSRRADPRIDRPAEGRVGLVARPCDVPVGSDQHGADVAGTLEGGRGDALRAEPLDPRVEDRAHFDREPARRMKQREDRRRAVLRDDGGVRHEGADERVRGVVRRGVARVGLPQHAQEVLHHVGNLDEPGHERAQRDAAVVG